MVPAGLGLRRCLVLVQSELLDRVLHVLLVLMTVLWVLTVLAKVRLYWGFLCGYVVQ